MKFMSMILICFVGVLSFTTFTNVSIEAGIGAGLLGIAVAILEKD